MKKVILLTLVLAASGLAAEGEISRYLLNEQLSIRGNEKVKSHIKIAEKVGKFLFVENEEKNKVLPSVTETDKERGYVMFTKSYMEEVNYNSLPLKSEIKDEVNIFATPGEYEPCSVGVYPLKDLLGVKVTAEDFVNEKGEKIKAANADIRFVRYMVRGVQPFIFKMAPEAMEKFTSLDIKQGVTTRFWVTIKVPETAGEGLYKGKLTLTSKSGKPAVFNVNLKVLSFVLKSDPKVKFGFFYHEPFTDEAIKREAQDMKEHGCTSIGGVALPKIKKVNGKTVELDFTDFSRKVALYKEAGLPVYWGNVIDFYNALTSVGLKELSPEFNVAFKDAVAKTQKWTEDNKVDFIFDIFDEPREGALNAWNRNGADTVKYLKLCKEIPNVRTMVIIMGDLADDKKDYTQMVPDIDVVMTHQWDKSKGLMKKSRELKKELLVDNNGFNRIAWGFCVWKMGASGNFQYAYFGYKGANAFAPVPTGYTENPGGGNTRPSYVTETECIPSARMEWLREGTDDYKYIYTLETLLKELGADKNAAKAVKAGKKLLEDIGKVIPDYPSSGLVRGDEAGEGGTMGEFAEKLDEFRWKIAQSITELQKFTVK